MTSKTKKKIVRITMMSTTNRKNRMLNKDKKNEHKKLYA